MQDPVIHHVPDDNWMEWLEMQEWLMNIGLDSNEQPPSPSQSCERDLGFEAGEIARLLRCLDLFPKGEIPPNVDAQMGGTALHHSTDHLGNDPSARSMEALSDATLATIQDAINVDPTNDYLEDASVACLSRLDLTPGLDMTFDAWSEMLRSTAASILRSSDQPLVGTVDEDIGPKASG
ncbi:hypothetical protein QFC22_006722 [Naganishia vaughanmartiniae]|uniref:Uncharacterized protein n=1 Tax=Naganishia vaughanmartiniae TaxID=1424756 RepID=A0ACC2WFI4_9TREE|nr:hypothetical protein QFC22_006722 [Naganishia vaughanmartiniae]